MRDKRMKQFIKPLVPPIIWDSARAARRRFRHARTVSNPIHVGLKEAEYFGLRWRLDMSSCISRQIIEKGVWEQETTKVIFDLVGEGMQVLAIGANFGYYALLMAQRVGPNGHVWAFEPTQKYRQQLQWHIEANRFRERVTIVPFGLSDCARSANIDLTLNLLQCITPQISVVPVAR